MQTTFNRILIATTIAWQLALPVQSLAQSSTLPTGAVATVNGTPVTKAEVDAVIQASRQPDTPQFRQAIKNQLIARVLIQQAADKASYGSKPEVQAAMQLAKSTAETQLFVRDNVKPEPVSDAQVKARYDEIVASLGKEEIKPRIIVTKDVTTAATVLAGLKAGQSFDALAQQYSQAPTAAAGGELPWVSFKTPVTDGNTQGLPLSVAQAITQLPVGGVTPQSIALGNDANGPRAIVKVDAKRPTQVPSFDAAKATIQQQLQALALEKATANFVGGLMKNASIQQ
ncbi:peptidylprolyl isomerase [Burkholderia cenocepacia]|uniref:peptidylprolyl isomerase n=1 Tax=Burkholderia cenocepacia TaxID=95486 RepID=UPI00078E020C|nr:peptidylprolyl isomerase [Burkholderia cenocepacia]AMU19152.1 peptidylprolyl isomerase [Burkholderia cenocepacia]MDI9700367.1 peptidylprolyl isomerase [Burkholderia cenocepacia]